MALLRSHNGWPALISSGSPKLHPLPAITGSVLAGPIWVIFNELAKRYSREVEPIRREWSWGHHFRMVRGSITTLSNHSSGTAVDLNAPAHPLGRGGTFKAAQVAAIRAILRDFGGVLRWGGDFGKRPDEMHWEIAPGVTEAQVAALANKLTAPAKPTPPLPPIVKPAVPVTGVVANCAAVNIRDGAATTYRVQQTVPAGTRVTLTGPRSGEWLQVKVAGRVGWMHGKYFRKG